MIEAGVTRFEVIDHRKDSPTFGRAFVSGTPYGPPVNVELSYQDNGHTLKIFVTDQPQGGK